MSSVFDEFVKIQTEEKNDSSISVESEKQEWDNWIHELYKIVTNYLKEYTNDKRIEITLSDIDLHEDQFGFYKTKALSIIIGKKVVEFRPKGRFVIGAYGRVDMAGPAGTIKIVLVDKNSDKPYISVSSLPPISKQMEKAWKISTPPPHIKYYDLDDKEIFFDALMKVANG
ncbi:MAG: hypothetical protein LBS53_07905 [Synergistaceae bacterium]|nr:hypothetical protein [Synergistaceae bacterium]